ncbi:hypothetical protein [Cognatiluteimonas profundi]|uniref:hypothetical protein n=1 Tax=Cognatiluteimonas profundi TaxID=2594501 RepID=UPI00131BA041|nr:hypothetical protein [Lysobacter profundi]
MPPAIGALPSDSIPVRDSAPSTDVGGPSQVSMVYRCVGKHGAVSLQSQPCAAGERVTRAIFAPPDAESLPRPTFAAPNGPSVAEYTDAAPAVDDARDRRRRECADAGSSREATLARVGLARTYDLLHQLDAMVQEACKGL